MIYVHVLSALIRILEAVGYPAKGNDGEGKELHPASTELLQRATVKDQSATEDQLATIQYHGKDEQVVPSTSDDAGTENDVENKPDAKERVTRVERSATGVAPDGNYCIWIPIRYPVVKSCSCSC